MPRKDNGTKILVCVLMLLLMCAVLMAFCMVMFPVTVRAETEEPESTSGGALEELLEQAAIYLPSPEEVTGASSSSSAPEPEELEEDEAEPEGEEPPMIAPLAVTGTVYQGAISTTYLDYFRGFLSHRPGTPYVVFRSDAYNYYMFYGDGLKLNGYTFTGSGQYVRFYTQTGLIYRGTDTININAVNGFVYSNMSDAFPAFYEERGLLNEKTILVALGVLVGLWILSKLFFRNR